ncbi:MAG: glycosyltransferase [Candidatus Eremiobacterota bacterium]
MRLGIFTNAYRPIISGVVNSVDLIRKGLLAQGHVPYVFAPEFPGYRDQHAGVLRFRSLSLSSRVEFPLAIPYSTRIFPRIPRMRLDVLHAHHPFLLGDVAVHFARKLNLPLVFTFHTQYEQYAHYIPLPKKAVQAAARRAVRAYARRCDLIICPSPVLKTLLQEEYRLDTRLETLPNAIDLSRFQGVQGDGLRRSLGFGPEDVVAVYAGRIGLEKNLAFLLRAFARVQDTRARLLVVGDGPELANLKAQAQALGISPRVRFTGKVEYGCMPAYYAAADLFAITSTTEVKPLVVLEAMASGLPVVAVAACGTQDTVTHEGDGLLCPCREEDFRAILERAMADPDLRSRMSVGARRTSQGTSIETYTERLVELYRDLLRRRIP